MSRAVRSALPSAGWSCGASPRLGRPAALGATLPVSGLFRIESREDVFPAQPIAPPKKVRRPARSVTACHDAQRLPAIRGSGDRARRLARVVSASAFGAGVRRLDHDAMCRRTSAFLAVVDRHPSIFLEITGRLHLGVPRKHDGPSLLATLLDSETTLVDCGHVTGELASSSFGLGRSGCIPDRLRWRFRLGSRARGCHARLCLSQQQNASNRCQPSQPRDQLSSLPQIPHLPSAPRGQGRRMLEVSVRRGQGKGA
jgi:hypothetical protein